MTGWKVLKRKECGIRQRNAGGTYGGRREERVEKKNEKVRSKNVRYNISYPRQAAVI
jgi:hypothetical protein